MFLSSHWEIPTRKIKSKTIPKQKKIHFHWIRLLLDEKQTEWSINYKPALRVSIQRGQCLVEVFLLLSSVSLVLHWLGKDCMGVYMYFVCPKVSITLERSDKLKCFCTANETLKFSDNWKFRTKYFQVMHLIKV